MRYLLVLLLTGCAAQELTQDQRNAIIATYGPRCEAAGYQRDSEPWRLCIVGLVDRERQSSAQAFARGLQAAGGTLNPQVYQQGYQGPTYTNCTQDYLGTHCTTTPY